MIRNTKFKLAKDYNHNFHKIQFSEKNGKNIFLEKNLLEYKQFMQKINLKTVESTLILDMKGNGCNLDAEIFQ